MFKEHNLQHECFSYPVRQGNLADNEYFFVFGVCFIIRVSLIRKSL